MDKDYRINFWDTAGKRCIATGVILIFTSTFVIGQERFVHDRRKSLNRVSHSGNIICFVACPPFI